MRRMTAVVLAGMLAVMPGQVVLADEMPLDLSGGSIPVEEHSESISEERCSVTEGALDGIPTGNDRIPEIAFVDEVAVNEVAVNEVAVDEMSADETKTTDAESDQAKTETEDPELMTSKVMTISGSGEVRTVRITDNYGRSNMRVAVWSAEGGQDDISWYDLKKQADGSWQGTIKLENLNHSGHCYAHAYTDTATFIDGETFYVLPSEIPDKPKDTVILNGSGANATLTVTTASDYSNLRVAIWSAEGGQDDIKWYNLTKQANGSWTVSNPLRNLKHAGSCYAHVYTDEATFVCGNTFVVQESDIPKNVLTVSGSGANRTVTVTPAGSYSNMRVAVWSGEGGHDDIRWYNMTRQPNGSWQVSFPLSNLRHSGICYADAYTDQATFVCGSTFQNDQVAPAVGQVSVIGSEYNRTILVSGGSGSFKKVTAAVWSQAGGQDDLSWTAMQKQSDGSWQVSVPWKKLKHSGTVYVHIYADDTFLDAAAFACSDNDLFRGQWLYGNDSPIDYVQCAINIARDDSIGYGHTWPSTISCAGLVGLALTYCGYGDFIKDDPLGWGYIDLGSEYEQELVNVVGCEYIPVMVTPSNYMSLLRPGDILYYYYDINNNHIGFYIGNGLTVEARGPGGSWVADENGYEVAIYNWTYSPIVFQGIYRIPQSRIHYTN